MHKDHARRLLELAKRKGVLRPRDLEKHGIPRVYLGRLVQAGLLERIARGLYVAAGIVPDPHQSFAEACKRVPKGVVCLLSALRFHELTTQAPFQVWLAIGVKDWRPRLTYPPLRIVRFSKKTLTSGVEKHRAAGVTFRVFNPAKTVADCFKYRQKIGLDVALEALRDCWRTRRCTMDDLWKYAKICRVQNVIRPYLESLVQ